MSYGVLVLLDALGTQIGGSEIEKTIKNFDKADSKLRNYCYRLKNKLQGYKFTSLIYTGTIYDNFQIFLPIDHVREGYTDMSGKTPFWWTIISMGNLLIPFFRYALVNGVFLRGTITSGLGGISRKKRIIGPIANEASKYYEKANWLGIIASNHTALVLNNKKELNENQSFDWGGLLSPFIEYNVPIKKCAIIEQNIYKYFESREKFWVLNWPISNGYELTQSNEKYIVFTPTAKKTFYGKNVDDKKIEKVLNEGVSVGDNSKSIKWKNTLDFYEHSKKMTSR